MTVLEAEGLVEGRKILSAEEDALTELKKGSSETLLLEEQCADDNTAGTLEKKKKRKKKKKDEANGETEEQGVADDSASGEVMYTGIVAVRHGGFGFIKSPELESRVYFHVKDTDKKCHGGSLVRFTLEQSTEPGTKAVAKNIVTIRSAEPRPKEVTIDGVYTGTVYSLPSNPSTDAQVDDGMISFIDQEGCQQQAFFGTCRVSESDTPLQIGHPVQFNLAQQTTTKMYIAYDVKVDKVALDAAENAEARVHEANDEDPQMGKVILLKKEFGFIKRLGHSSDLFFHFSEVDKDPEKLQVGDDLKFVVKKDKDGRPCACHVTRAPPGSVTFETVSECEYHGVVIGKPNMSKSPGVIDFIEKPLNLKKQNRFDSKAWNTTPKMKILFHASESDGISALRVGDHITFKILTDVNAMVSAHMSGKGLVANLIARRAVQVHPVKSVGTIVSIKDSAKGPKGFGFLTWNGIIPSSSEETSDHTAKRSPQQRLYFHKSDISPKDPVDVGDVVYFTLHQKNGSEPIACRIRTKEKSGANPTSVADTKLPSKLQHLHLRASKVNQQTKPSRMPRGPDGTRGFALARGSYLFSGDHSTATDDIIGLCAGLKLNGIYPDMPRTLSAGAIPFTPFM